MSLQLTPFDPFAHRPPTTPPEPPSPAAAVPSVSAGAAASNGTAGGRSSGSPPHAAPGGTPQAAASAGGQPAVASRPEAVPSTVSLGQPQDKPATAEQPPAGRIPEKAKPPMSDQLLEFLHSMWQAGAQAITLPKEDDGQGAVDGVAAVAGAQGADAAAAGRQPEARSAMSLQAPAGQPPAQGSALYDGAPPSAPAAEPLVYSDPSLRRPSGR